MAFVFRKNKLLISAIVIFVIINIKNTNAATITSIANGNWSNPNTWQITTTKPGTITALNNSRIVTGSALANFTNNISIGNQLLNTSNQVIGIVQSIQSATSLTLVANAAFATNNAGWNSRGIGPSDDAVISSGNTVSVDANVSCASLTMQIANANNTLEISGTNTLSITGNLLMNVPNSGNVSTINVAAGTINCGSLTMNASTAGNNNIINISSGRLNINGNTTTGTTGCQLNISSNGTLELGGTVGGFTLSLGTASSTVVYDANGAQTMRAEVYHNLTIAGSGIKTVSASTTVNGILNIEGTAILSTSITTFGANSGIRYNTPVARFTDVEWPATFSGTAGVSIANTGVISQVSAKTLNTNVPFQIVSGANYSSNNNSMTINGTFTNAGTFTATTSVLTFNGNLINQNIFNANNALLRVGGDFTNTGTFNGGTCTFNLRLGNNQNIDGFNNTLGIIQFTKTGGTATLLGNVSTGSLLMSVSTGTLDLGANLSHTINGNISLTSTHTILGNSSTLTIFGTTTGAGTTFVAGTSTVRWLGANQDIAGFTYHNLELGGSGVKTMATNLTTINNRFNISGTASVQQRATLGIGGDFIISDGAFFRAGNFSLFIADSLIVGGGSSGIFRIGSVRSRTFNTIVVNAGGNFTDSSNSNYTISGDIRVLGTFSSGTGGVNLNGINKTISGNVTFNNLVNLSGAYSNNGTLTFNSSPLGIGTLTNNSTGILNFNFLGNVDISNVITNTIGNSVHYMFAGNQTVHPTNYFNLTLSGSGIKTLNVGTSSILNNFTISGTASSNAVVGLSIGNNLTLNNNASINFGSFTHTIAGNFIVNSGTTINSNSANLILSGNNKTFQNNNGISNLNSIQIPNGRVSFISSIVVGDLIIGSNGLFDFAGFNANLEITNTISGDGKIKAGTCGAAANTIKISGANANFGSVNFDATNHHIQSLVIQKTNGSVIINSDVSISGIIELPSTGTSSVEFKKILNLYSDFSIVHTSNTPKLIFTDGSSLIIGECITSGLFVILPSNLFITPPVLKALIINNTTGFQLGNELISITELLSIKSGNLNTNNQLRLRSTASKTARVEKVTGSISGDVIVERFIPGGNNKRQWRFLSSPINTNGSTALTQYQDDIFVTAPAEASGGFDVNPFARNASIRTYDEAITGSLNNGWTNPTNINNTIATGIGAEVFVRGSRNLANPFLNWTVPDDVTIDYIGALNTGNISPTINFTNTGSGTNDGFNLVGNPYASPINFDTSGLIKTNIENKYWCFNPNTRLYGAFNASTGESINGMTKYISSGQAFFIRANATSPQLTFTENAKVSVEGNNYYRTSANNGKFPVLQINLIKSADELDESLIILQPNSSYTGNDDGDMLKFFNNTLNLYTQSADRFNMSMNCIPNTRAIDTINLSVWSYDTSSVSSQIHQLQFERLESIDESIGIYLIDVYLNKQVNIRKNNSYSFLISSDPDSYGNNRFKIVFDQTNTGIQNNTSERNSFLIYPNPSEHTLYIQHLSDKYTSANCRYKIISITGTLLTEGELTFSNSSANLNIDSFSEGLYFLHLYTEEGSQTYKFFKK